MARCDCLNYCGDDPWLKDGSVLPCSILAESRRRAALREGIVVRHAEFDASGKVLTITYASPLNAEQQAMALPSLTGGNHG